MKILYKQSGSDFPFSLLKIGDCCFRELRYKRDRANVKEHHHTEYEIHIIKRGFQNYEVSGKHIHIAEGEFLLVPPHLRHRAENFAEGTEKYALTLRMDGEDVPLFHGALPPTAIDNISFILSEAEREREISETLIANRLFETAVLIFREAGMPESCAVYDEHVTNERFALAKQYINDNVEQNLSVGEIADYCYIGRKQLTRIFVSEVGMTPLEYINQARAEHIKTLLNRRELSIGQISRMMNFSSEYYFSAFFKRRFGMPPGEYRRMYCGAI